MKVNRKHITETFDTYTSNYNLEDSKIRLKYDHTYRVADFCEQIARVQGLCEADIDLAWVLGMFHDIGRFEQVRRYGTFQDKDSVNHAALSADLLFCDGYAKLFLNAGEEEMILMDTAVRFHNIYILPEKLTERELLFCNILRDADKIDILRVNCETPREEIYNLSTEVFENSDMTDEVYEGLMNLQPVNRKYSRPGIDYIMGHIGFVFDLAFDESKSIIKKQGYLDELMDFQSKNTETQMRIETVRDTVRKYLKKY